MQFRHHVTNKLEAMEIATPHPFILLPICWFTPDPTTNTDPNKQHHITIHTTTVYPLLATAVDKPPAITYLDPPLNDCIINDPTIINTHAVDKPPAAYKPCHNDNSTNHFSA